MIIAVCVENYTLDQNLVVFTGTYSNAKNNALVPVIRKTVK